MAMVFASSGGDGETIHEILRGAGHRAARGVADALPQLCPQCAFRVLGARDRFARSRASALSAYDDSFAAGLLEAAVQVDGARPPVTLIAYDVPYPAAAARGAPDCLRCSAWPWSWRRAGGAGARVIDVAIADVSQAPQPGWRIRNWNGCAGRILRRAGCRCWRPSLAADGGIDPPE